MTASIGLSSMPNRSKHSGPVNVVRDRRVELDDHEPHPAAVQRRPEVVVVAVDVQGQLVEVLRDRVEASRSSSVEEPVKRARTRECSGFYDSRSSLKWSGSAAVRTRPALLGHQAVRVAEVAGVLCTELRAPARPVRQHSGAVRIIPSSPNREWTSARALFEANYPIPSWL
jgi:hypothetical protein